MSNNNIILNELQNLSSAVANIDRRNVYSVPSGYFNDLADQILHNVQQPESVLTQEFSNPFKVPQGYFEGLSNEILGKVKAGNSSQTEIEKELSEVAPLLNSISKANLYKVPQGFFETLSIRKGEEQAKVISFSSTRKFVRYAVAASVTGIMAIGGYFYFNDDKAINYAQSGFNKQEVHKLSDDEIIEYLNNNPSATEVSFTNKKVENDFEKYTKELTEEEIDDYLKANSEVGEIDQKEG
jgi:hypothetical protein